MELDTDAITPSLCVIVSGERRNLDSRFNEVLRWHDISAEDAMIIKDPSANKWHMYCLSGARGKRFEVIGPQSDNINGVTFCVSNYKKKLGFLLEHCHNKGFDTTKASHCFSGIGVSDTPDVDNVQDVVTLLFPIALDSNNTFIADQLLLS